jgi:cytochrome c
MGYIHFSASYLLSSKTIIFKDDPTNLNNHPPIVKIISPASNSLFTWNSQIEYTIKISDVEDGESDDLAITSNEVFLEVMYVPDTARAKEYIGKKIPSHFESPGLQLLMKADCLNCHAVKTSVQGPAFQDIARKYSTTPGNVKMLATRVIEGSSGVWGISAMASHPELTQPQAEQIIEWILENAEDPNRTYYSGTKGSFQTKAKPENDKEDMYILTASYTDRGLKGIPQSSKTGLHTIILRSK